VQVKLDKYAGILGTGESRELTLMERQKKTRLEKWSDLFRAHSRESRADLTRRFLVERPR
jgi:hypothetical protein